MAQSKPTNSCSAIARAPLASMGHHITCNLASAKGTEKLWIGLSREWQTIGIRYKHHSQLLIGSKTTGLLK